MKISKTKSTVLGFIIILMVWACTKPFEKSPLPTTTSTQSGNTVIDLPLTKTTSSFTSNCNLISFTDTLVFLKLQKDDYKIKPIQTLKGQYGAKPQGMEIDHNTGEINVTKSETGLKYKVFFVPDKTTDTCFTYLAISGIDYKSKIFILNQNDTLAIPIYNANPNFVIPGSNSGSNNSGGGGSGNSGSGSSSSGSGSGSSGSGGSGSSGGGSSNSGSSSEFDDGDDDDNGDGTSDEPLPGQEVIPQGVAIDKGNGKITLSQSMKNGLFGSNPTSGSSKKFKIYYRIDDASGKALNYIEVQFHYYNTLSEVPQSLKTKIDDNNKIYSNGGRMAAGQNVQETVRKPRPPDLVIVARFQ